MNLSNYKDRELYIGDTVSVHWNLHKGGYTVIKKGLVVAHLQYLQLQHVSFHVNEKARQQVLKSGRKGVHAKIQGILQTCDNEVSQGKIDEAFRNPYVITYDPFTHKQFRCNGEGVERLSDEQTILSLITYPNPNQNVPKKYRRKALVSY